MTQKEEMGKKNLDNWSIGTGPAGEGLSGWCVLGWRSHTLC